MALNLVNLQGLLVTHFTHISVNMTTIFSEVRQLLQDTAARGDHIASLALEFGLPWARADLPNDVQNGQVGRCFWQTFQLALQRPERFTYVEGYAFNGRPIPIHHAWCVDDGGNVADPTWNIAPTAVYAGIPFKHEVLLQTCRNIKELEELNELGYLIGTISTKIIANPINYLKPKDSCQWSNLFICNKNWGS